MLTIAQYHRSQTFILPPTDDLYEPQTRPLSTAAINLQRTQTAIEPSTQQRTMSVTTSNRPKPVPRQKPGIIQYRYFGL